MEEQRLIVTASPHIRDSASNRSLMGNVIIALIPTVVASAFIFGMQRAAGGRCDHRRLCGALSISTALLMHKRNPVGDLSAVVTGIILALNVPVGMPLWICIVGAFVAIIIVKQMFGGLGYNVANPALVGRIVLFLGFTSRMTAYVYPDLAVDALASATPLVPAAWTSPPSACWICCLVCTAACWARPASSPSWWGWPSCCSPAPSALPSPAALWAPSLC